MSQHTQIKKYARWASVAAACAVVASIGPMSAMAPRGGDPNVQFDEARMYVVFDSTAQTMGFRVALDGAPWKRLRIDDPNNKRIFDLQTFRDLKAEQGITAMSFASGDPLIADVPLVDFAVRFPAGVYKFKGNLVEQDGIDADVTFTHIIPAGPVINTPVEDSVQDPATTVVDWDAVGNPVGSTITSYQVVVTQDLAGFPKRTFSVVLPASVTNVTVPTEFLVAGADYTLKVYATEAGGNQSMASSTFSVTP